LEPWEKAWVNVEEFLGTEHGEMGCQECHGGVQDADKGTAHTGLIARPSQAGMGTCQECHPDETAAFPDSLHVTQEGYWASIEGRGASRDHEAISEMFGNHCQSCHTSCGDCHVSQPASVGGGFIDGHVFNKTPSMTRNCTACHGSRVGNEYLGKHEGLPPDVHFRQGRMTCMDCHGGQEMHSMEPDCEACHTESEIEGEAMPSHRYDGMQLPSCETCHTTVTTGEDGNLMHEQHGTDLSCQVCHSLPYSNCNSCHVSISEETGNPKFTTQGSFLAFLIGRNTRQDHDRLYSYVPVRHIPIDAESYSYYGDNLLPNFNALPTWVYATPHNIQRETPQNASCLACHDNPDLFLTLDKVAPEEAEANRSVIIETISDPFP
jgi:thiosulfate/3-mercaptopyruvate sulfurtransferase